MTDGIMLMAYGTPPGIDGVEEYYTNILRGKKPPPEQLKRLIERYRAIGGRSPLLEVTFSQAKKLQRMMSETGKAAEVFVGMKYSRPYILDSLKSAADAGIERLACVPVAPFYSKISAESYFGMVDAAAASIGWKPEIFKVNSWSAEPGLIKAWQNEISKLGIDDSYMLLFTAHSMPVTPEDDLAVYTDQILEACAKVQAQFGNSWTLCFQSAADMPGRWIGPSAEQKVAELAESGIKNLAIIPIGFVTDNLETMYDAGIVLGSLCKSKGINFKVSKMPNDSDEIVKALFEASSRALGY
ncbi:MAG: ferrochelatase [Candidatus Micrarchaeales archaeon]|jgi:ferrochelatase|uniref:Ferrochelatase n=1 Tax=Candidatus Micrarchaeum acidiphilum ARMAN-2 TaxID=425595 RepID=C7DH19_MICA2|nr:MAG: Ferrochelatase [Candidatus Micrarchaeum acidiphilum ARMAN-2]MCW6161423.1 ferrochelatase [Candidatus Micrarchaeales archaeon]